MHGRSSIQPVPAVVVGGTLNALGVVRSLSRGGMPVVALDTTWGCPAAWSRHCTFVRVPSLEGEPLIDALLQLSARLRSRAVLILTSDQSVLAVSAARGRLAPLYSIDLPAPSIVEALADKARFHALAEREGFAVPCSRTVSSEAELDRIGELAPPVVVKPADKTLVLSEIVERAVRADTIGRARAVASRMLARAPSLIVQEWVEGPDTEIFFALFSCDRDGNLIGLFPGRKLVCSPPQVGSTAVCAAAPEIAGQLLTSTREFVRRVGYRGLGSLEFKRDSRSGRLLIIEPTVGRTDWQEEIATLCGLNLPLLTYEAALGRPAPSPGDGSFAPGHVWRSERRFSAPPALMTAATRVMDGYFRWDDPLPAAYYYGYERLGLLAWRRAVRLTRPTSRHIPGVQRVDFDTTILGAGPYGLSIAAHLEARRHPYEIFGRPMESWRKNMPEGMILKSEPFASNLWDPARRFTLEQYCRSQKVPYQAVGRPVSLESFLGYTEWFRRHTQEDPVDRSVISLRRHAKGFALRFEGGEEVTSRRIVLATGHLSYPVTPPELSHLPEPLVAHSSRMRPVSFYAGRAVTVIGAGQSALETAALLHEAGARVCVLVRRNVVSWNEPSKPRPLLERIRAPDAGIASGWGSWAISELPRTFRWLFAPEKRHWFVAGSYGASGSWWLRNRVEGRMEVQLSLRTEAAAVADGRVLLRVRGPGGTREIITDHVICATGYRVDIGRLDYLDAELRDSIRTEAAGIPSLSSTFETSVPGLYIVGVTSAPVFGPIMRFMYGAKHAAPIVAGALRRSR